MSLLSWALVRSTYGLGRIGSEYVAAVLVMHNCKCHHHHYYHRHHHHQHQQLYVPEQQHIKQDSKTVEQGSKAAST